MFAEKSKEPILSEYMQNVVKHSRGDTKGSYPIDNTIYYKTKIREELINDKDLLLCLHYEPFLGTEDECAGSKYLDRCIFEYMRLPDLKSDVRNFLCYEVEEQHGSNTTTDLYVVFRCISHKDDIRTDWGIPRMDLMSAIINKHFSWNNKFSNSFVKKNELTLIANNEYHVREITYVIKVPNQDYHKVNGRTLGGYR